MFSYTRLGIDNDHHFTNNTANNLPLRGGHSVVDPSCDVLSLGALYSWEFFLKFHLHACRIQKNLLDVIQVEFLEISLKGFAAVLVVLFIGASQSRQHCKSDI
ncbi:hypothetical protein Tco_0000700 [Tanacetum coccineum]